MVSVSVLVVMAKKWMSIIKLWSFPISAIPVTVGTALSTDFNLLLYLLMVVGIISLTFAANVLNDFFDFRHGFDRPSHTNSTKRVNPLILKAITERQMLVISAAFIILAALCGVYIALIRGPLVILAGVVGVFAVVFYTAGKRSIKSLGFGELLIFAIYGPAITASSFFVESGTFSYVALAASIPVGIVIAIILLANNIRDISADSDAGLRTMAVRLGAQRSRILFRSLIVLSYASVIIFSLFRILPFYSIITVASIPYAILIINKITVPRNVPQTSPQISLRFALVFGILLVTGILL